MPSLRQRQVAQDRLYEKDFHPFTRHNPLAQANVSSPGVTLSAAHSNKTVELDTSLDREISLHSIKTKCSPAPCSSGDGHERPFTPPAIPHDYGVERFRTIGS